MVHAVGSLTGHFPLAVLQAQQVQQQVDGLAADLDESQRRLHDAEDRAGELQQQLGEARAAHAAAVDQLQEAQTTSAAEVCS